jgi:hypothetical protein
VHFLLLVALRARDIDVFNSEFHLNNSLFRLSFWNTFQFTSSKLFNNFSTTFLMFNKHRFFGLICLVILLVHLEPGPSLCKDPLFHTGPLSQNSESQTTQTNLVTPNGKFPNRPLLDELDNLKSPLAPLTDSIVESLEISHQLISVLGFPEHVSLVDRCGNVNGSLSSTHWITDNGASSPSFVSRPCVLTAFDRRINLSIPSFGAAADLYLQPLSPRPETVLLSGPYALVCPFNCFDLIYCLQIVSRPRFLHSRAGIVRKLWTHSRYVICFHPDCAVTVAVTLPFLLLPGQLFYTCVLLLLVKFLDLVMLVQVYRAYAGTVKYSSLCIL